MGRMLSSITYTKHFITNRTFLESLELKALSNKLEIIYQTILR